MSEIIDYVMHTPHNSNPNVMRDILNNNSNSSNSSSGSTYDIVLCGYYENLSEYDNPEANYYTETAGVKLLDVTNLNNIKELTYNEFRQLVKYNHTYFRVGKLYRNQYSDNLLGFSVIDYFRNCFYSNETYDVVISDFLVDEDYDTGGFPYRIYFPKNFDDLKQLIVTSESDRNVFNFHSSTTSQHLTSSAVYTRFYNTDMRNAYLHTPDPDNTSPTTQEIDPLIILNFLKNNS